MAILVKKFGGSSVADVERVRRVAGIIADTYKEGNSAAVPWLRRKKFTAL